MKISVVIPTHNRPELLAEAVQSIIEQNYGDWEIIIVDDASSPSVSMNDIPVHIRNKVVLIKHEASLGVAATKNDGIKNATGDLCLFLDDDDLLANNAFSKIVDIVFKYSNIDILFINIEPFGKLASDARANQEKALNNIVAIGVEQEDNLIIFNKALFNALLESVPIAFQRPVFTRAIWEKTGGFRMDSYLPEPEWSIKSSMTCTCALLLNKLYFLRVDGQNLYSNVSQLEKHQNAIIETRLRLKKELDPGKDKEFLLLVNKSLADSYFDRSWNLFDKKNKESLRYLYESFIIKQEFRHFKLLIKILNKIIMGGIFKR